MYCFDPPSYAPEVEDEEPPPFELVSGEFGPGLAVAREEEGTHGS